MTDQLDAFKTFREKVTQDGRPNFVGHMWGVHQILQEHTTRDNPITQEEIANSLGISTATVRSCIMPLRRQGVFICTGQDGCWISRIDIQGTIDHLESRAHSELRTAAALKAELARTDPTQLEFNKLPLNEQLKRNREHIQKEFGMPKLVTGPESNSQLTSRLAVCASFRILESDLDGQTGVRTITKADLLDISIVPAGTKPTNDPNIHQQIHPLNRSKS